MQILQTIWRDMPLLVMIVLFFLIGLIGGGIDVAKRPKPISKSYLYQAPISDVSIFGIIGLFILGFAILLAAYWSYLNPYASTSIKSRWIQTLGGPYGLAVTSGLLGLFMLGVGISDARDYVKRKFSK